MRRMCVCLVFLGALLSSPLSAQSNLPGCATVAPFTDSARFRYFAPTQHVIGNGFLAFWNSHGGLAQFGYPIVEEFVQFGGYGEAAWTVQYFERAWFDYFRPTDTITRVDEVNFWRPQAQSHFRALATGEPLFFRLKHPINAIAGACEAPYERALTLLAMAALRAAPGDHAEAKRLLDGVKAICTPLAAKPTLAQADALAAILAEA